MSLKPKVNLLIINELSSFEDPDSWKWSNIKSIALCDYLFVSNHHKSSSITTDTTSTGTLEEPLVQTPDHCSSSLGHSFCWKPLKSSRVRQFASCFFLFSLSHYFLSGNSFCSSVSFFAEGCVIIKRYEKIVMVT